MGIPIQASIEIAVAKVETSSVLRKEFNVDLLRTFAVANIPIEKAPLIRPFLVKYCKQGGTCPTTADGLYYYSEDLYAQNRDVLKKLIEDQPLALVVDEATDDSSCSLLNIVVILLNGSSEQGSNPLLLDTVFLETINLMTVGQAVIQSVVTFGIKFDNVRLIMSDNAKYMLKCVREVLHPVFPKMHHSICWAHIINLVGSKWVDLFADVNSFCV